MFLIDTICKMAKERSRVKAEQSRRCGARLETLAKLEKYFNRRDARSVIFLHHSYYNFYYLAAALRRRGWNAVNIMWDPLSHPDRQYLHGADIELYDDDDIRFRENLNTLYQFALAKAKMVHFAGVGRMSFFPENMDSTYYRERVPWDFLEAKKLGVRIGYTHSGCCDLVSQTSFYRWSGGVCDYCRWQNEPSFCSDLRNLAWGHAVQSVCDLICIETEPMLDFKAHPAVFREPLTMVLDPEIWHPSIAIPEEVKFERSADEVIVLHSMGNFEMRAREGDNVKGTRAVVEAIENLRRKGFKIRLLFHDSVASSQFRYIQAQADIIVDQLRYGRYGATAREAMMLGKPTVGYINATEWYPGAESQCIVETPIVNASVNNIEAVLQQLIENPERRLAIGEASRAHAIKWWSADTCAERYEHVYDRLMAGKRPMEAPITLPQQ